MTGAPEPVSVAGATDVSGSAATSVEVGPAAGKNCLEAMKRMPGYVAPLPAPLHVCR